MIPLNSDFTRGLFKFGSCLLLFITSVLFKIVLIVSSFFKISILFFKMPNASLFFGLYVDIKGVMFSSFFSWTLNKSSLGISKALVIPDFIICNGYFLSIKVVVSSFKWVSSVDLFEINIQSLHAKEKGMLIFVCFGWHELEFKYCLESVAL